MMEIHADPSYRRFLEPFDNISILKLPISEKRSLTLSGKVSKSVDSLRQLIFNETDGVMLIFYQGNFKIYDPFNFTKLQWHHEEMNLQQSELRHKNITFVIARYSSERH